MSDPNTPTHPPPPLLTADTPIAALLPNQLPLSTQAIDIGPGSPPVPKKLAEQIWKGEYIELRELLPSQLGAPQPTILDLFGKAEKPRQKKEISSIQEWILAFNALVVIIAQRQPERVPDLLAYSSLITRASIDYEDMPWLAYDAHFRRQAAARPQSRWAQLDSSLWTVYFSRARPKTYSRSTEDSPTQKSPKGGSKARPTPYTKTPVCRKWNSANGCNLPVCRYQHCCLKCNSPSHQGSNCPSSRSQPDQRNQPFRLDAARP